MSSMSSDTEKLAVTLERMVKGIVAKPEHVNVRMSRTAERIHLKVTAHDDDLSFFTNRVMGAIVTVVRASTSWPVYIEFPGDPRLSR